MSKSIQIASVFTAIGFKVDKRDLVKLQKLLGSLKKDIRSFRNLAKIEIQTNTPGLKRAREQLVGINSELAKIKSRSIKVNVNRSDGGGVGRRGGGSGRGGAFAGGALGSQLGQFGPGVGVAGAVGFGGLSILRAGQQLEAVRAGLTAAAGSAKAGAEAFQFMIDTSDRLGINFEDNVRSYQNFLAAGRSLNFSTQKTREVFTATASAARVLGLSAADTNGIMRAMTQILSKGTVQSEELRGQLGERLPGAVGMMAKAIGVTVEQLNKMLEQGQVISKDALPKLADAMIAFAKTNGALDKAMNSNLANQERMANAWFFFKANIAESGFMTAMTETFVDFTRILQGTEKSGASIGKLFTGVARVFKSLGNVVGAFIVGISEMPGSIQLALVALTAMLIPYATWALAIVAVIGILEELFAMVRGEDNLITNFIENIGLTEVALLSMAAAIAGILIAGKLSLAFEGMRAAATGVTALTRGIVLLRAAMTLLGKHPVFLALTAIAAVAAFIVSSSEGSSDVKTENMVRGLGRRGGSGTITPQAPDLPLDPSGYRGRGTNNSTIQIRLSDDLKADISEMQVNQPITIPDQ